MNGELDFTASLEARVALLKGIPADVFEKLKSVITITPGARELCKALKRLGFKMAVLSGGFTPLAEWLAGQLGLDYCYANNVGDSRLRDQPLLVKLLISHRLVSSLIVPMLYNARSRSVNTFWRLKLWHSSPCSDVISKTPVTCTLLTPFPP